MLLTGGQMPTTSIPILRAAHLLEPVRRGISAFSSLSGLPPNSRISSQRRQHWVGAIASLKPPGDKGFGKKNVVEKKSPAEYSSPSSEASESGRSRSEEAETVRSNDEGDDVIPEVVTNRMLKRIAFTVGVPLAVGVLFFPLFYYLKVVNKVDVPEWLPLLVSMITFGTAGFGITYGVVSSSWDPAREGSLSGWKEAQVNWPLIWDKVQGKQDKR